MSYKPKSSPNINLNFTEEQIQEAAAEVDEEEFRFCEWDKANRGIDWKLEERFPERYAKEKSPEKK